MSIKNWMGRVLPALGLLVALAGFGVAVYLSVNEPPESPELLELEPEPAPSAQSPVAQYGNVLTVADFPTAAGVAAPAPGHREGDRIPDFTLGLADGAAITSAGLVAAERPTFLFFFATT